MTTYGNITIIFLVVFVLYKFVMLEAVKVIGCYQLDYSINHGEDIEEFITCILYLPSTKVVKYEHPTKTNNIGKKWVHVMNKYYFHQIPFLFIHVQSST